MTRRIDNRIARGIIIAMILLACAYLVIAPRVRQNEAKTPLDCPRVTAAWFVPAPTMFGQTDTRPIIHSDYSNEASLLGGNAPVDDIDMMHPYWNQPVKLPGDARDRYYYLGGRYIPGSGWAQEYSIGIVGGRFAFLHMQSLPGVTPPQAVQSDPGLPRTCEDQTVASVAAMEAPGISLLRGGTYVGWSGYPTWAMYANGAPGPGDAHLCLVLDSASVAYFYRIATRGPIPRRFPARRWGSRVSAYYHHHLTRTALFWWHHMHFGKALTQSYHRGHPGFHRTTFAHHVILCWDNGKCRIR